MNKFTLYEYLQSNLASLSTCMPLPHDGVVWTKKPFKVFFRLTVCSYNWWRHRNRKPTRRLEEHIFWHLSGEVSESESRNIPKVDSRKVNKTPSRGHTLAVQETQGDMLRQSWPYARLPEVPRSQLCWLTTHSQMILHRLLLAELRLGEPPVWTHFPSRNYQYFVGQRQLSELVMPCSSDYLILVDK